MPFSTSTQEAEAGESLTQEMKKKKILVRMDKKFSKVIQIM